MKDNAPKHRRPVSPAFEFELIKSTNGKLHSLRISIGAAAALLLLCAFGRGLHGDWLDLVNWIHIFK